ncbi:hypothetical protein RND81_05G268600 [Saponaria officinalis]|uniref:Xyloglucan endotransglucosylase/hydrolase n=1 Tax=Saponaria officinalis TaxID=3572 RepID=A0AAW1L406_SAPOF
MLQMWLKLILIVCTLITLSYSLPSNSVKFNDVFKWLCGNISVSDDGNSVIASLKNGTGSSGFVSLTNYTDGLFSAYIKLPPQNYTAGIVVTFYLSNTLEQHDEIDFEFLGHTDIEEWILQTNFYGNGNFQGKEERYKLGFDPSKEAHKYSIYWADDHILYYIDNVPIREVKKVDGVDYPSKPMALYAAIWDGSDWATDGGKAKANYTFEPFVAEYSNFAYKGCWIDPNQNVRVCGGSDLVEGNGIMTPPLLEKYETFRKEYLTYSYCLDKARYNTTMPECLVPPLQ